MRCATLSCRLFWPPLSDAAPRHQHRRLLHLSRTGVNPIRPRPGCSPEAIEAVEHRDTAAIARIAAHGGTFTCGPANRPLPLDDAVMHDDIGLVQALLDAHADPNARWGSHGDRFPLQEALERWTHESVADRRGQIIRVLGEHGADVNQRWCEFESRGQDESDACTSPFGVTPLLMAAMQDDPGAVFLLLQAGANARLENQFGSNALEDARSEAVFSCCFLATSFDTRAIIYPRRSLMTWAACPDYHLQPRPLG